MSEPYPTIMALSRAVINLRAAAWQEAERHAETGDRQAIDYANSANEDAEIIEAHIWATFDPPQKKPRWIIATSAVKPSIIHRAGSLASFQCFTAWTSCEADTKEEAEAYARAVLSTKCSPSSGWKQFVSAAPSPPSAAFVDAVSVLTGRAS